MSTLSEYKTPHVVGVTNLKGGCGKSHLALLLAHQYDRAEARVLVVDADADQANAVLLATGARNPVSGVVRASRWGFEIVYVNDPDDLPDLSAYDRVVVDGRPSGTLAGLVAGLSDIIVVPYVDALGRYEAQRFAELVAGRKPVMLIRNCARRGQASVRAFPRLEAVRRRRWHEVQVGFAGIVDAFYQEHAHARRPQRTT